MEWWSLGGGGAWLAFLWLIVACSKKRNESRQRKAVASTYEQLKPVSPVVTTLPKTQSDAVTTTTETLKVPPPSLLPSTLTKPKKTEKTQSDTKTGAEMEKLEEGVKTATSFAKGPGDCAETTKDEDTAAVSQMSQLSEAEPRQHQPHRRPFRSLPSIPLPDDDQGHHHHHHHHPARKPLNFVPRGRVKHVPKDQMQPHGVDKRRLKSNPERRNHVLSTISEKGGHVIDKTTSATREVDATGQRVVSWLYVPPAKERAKNVAATA